MSLVTSSQVISVVHNAGSAAALDDPAAILQAAYVEQYQAAKEQYKHSHARFSTRGAAPVSCRMGQFCLEAFQDLSWYTSAHDLSNCCEPSSCIHTRRRGLHILNYELRQRALPRYHEALRQLARHPERRKPGTTAVVQLLVESEKREMKDLMELQFDAFKELAKQYYTWLYGAADRTVMEEKMHRKILEDEESLAATELLDELREEIFWCEQRLIVRGMNIRPGALPHLSLLRAMRAEELAQQQKGGGTLEVMYITPLQHRVAIIRSETESEEDIVFKRIVLACESQAHAISSGYLSRDTRTGNLMRTAVRLPYSMIDIIEYAFNFELFAVIVDEETDRMRIEDAADGALVELFSSLTAVVEMEGEREKDSEL